jgi:hypothetical protein
VPQHHRVIARLMGDLSQRDLRALRALLGRLRDRLEPRLTGTDKQLRFK